uniref:Uncharacterized protein n=1 Tax=Manihot esculenta TaxID=3983 RepID=A0A2C9V5V5_MANES
MAIDKAIQANNCKPRQFCFAFCMKNYYSSTFKG